MNEQQEQTIYQPNNTLDQLAYNFATQPIQPQQYRNQEISATMGLDVTPPDKGVVLGNYLHNLGSNYMQMQQQKRGKEFLKNVHDTMSGNLTPEERINHLIDLKAQHGTDYGLGLDEITKQLGLQNEIKSKGYTPKTFDEAVALEKAKKTATTDDLMAMNMPQLQIGATPEEKNQFLSQLPSGTQALVKGLTDYSLDLSKVSSIRGNQRQLLASLAKQYDPSFDMNQFNARKNFVNNLANGNLSKSVISANTLIGHINGLQESYNQLHNSKVPLFNAVGNISKQAVGSGTQTQLKANANAVANELETLFRGTGGGSMQGIEDWKKQISVNASPEQSKAFIGKAIELMASRLQAIDSQYKNIMGKPREFSVLNNKSKQILQNIGIDPSQVEYSPENLYMQQTGQQGNVPNQPQSPMPQQQSQMITATNPNTGQKIISSDGGQTWRPMQ